MSNPLSSLTEYDFRHLVIHLIAAKKAEELYLLLTLETENRRNAWYDIKKDKFNITDYTDDIFRAYKLAKSAFDTTDLAKTTKSLYLQIRYALMLGSVNSISANLYPLLIRELVRVKIISHTQALAYSRSAESNELKGKALTLLIPFLPEPLKSETIKEVFTLGSSIEKGRIEWFHELLEFLPDEFTSNALETVKETTELETRIGMFFIISSRLLPSINELFLLEILEEAGELGGKDELLSELAKLTSSLPMKKKVEALNKALSSARERYSYDLKGKVKSLLAVASLHIEPFKSEIIQEAYSIAVSIELESGDYESYHFRDGRERAEALATVFPFLKEPLRKQVLESVFEAVQHTYSSPEQAKALTKLATYLPQKAKRKILQKAIDSLRKTFFFENSYHQLQALQMLAKHSSKSQLKQLLEVALDNIENIPHKTDALAFLAPKLEEPAQTRVFHEVFLVLESDQISSWEKSEIIVEIAPYLPESLLQKAISVAELIDEVEQRSQALANLAVRFTTRAELEKIFYKTQIINDLDEYAWTLSHLAPCMSQSNKQMALQSALTAAREVTDNWWRGEILVRLLPHLPNSSRESAVREAVKAADEIETPIEQLKAELLTKLAEYLNKSLMDEAYQIAQKMKFSDLKARALAGLLPFLEGRQKREAIEYTLRIARSLEDEDAQERLLIKVAPYASGDELAKTLKLSEAIFGESYYSFPRSQTIAPLLQYLPKELRQPALEKAIESALENWKQEDLKADELLSIASALPNLRQKKMLKKVYAISSKIKDPQRKAKIFAQIGSKLDKSSKKKIAQFGLKAAEEAKEAYVRSEILVSLAPYFDEKIQPRVIKLASETDDFYRLKVLISLLPYLNDSLRNEALQKAADTLLTNIKNIHEADTVKKLMEIISKHLVLPDVATYTLINNTFQLQLSFRRKTVFDIIKILAPIFASLNNKSINTKLFFAIEDVKRWWT